jgi:uncharacterized protein (TIGR02246 family)
MAFRDHTRAPLSLGTEDVEDVIIRFAAGSNDANLEVVAELLTDDATLDGPGQSIAFGPGRDEILEYIKKAAGDRDSRGESERHLITNIRVDIAQDNTAIARSHVTLILTTADCTTGVHGFARYEDRLVQANGAWRLAARRFCPKATNSQPPPFAEPRHSRHRDGLVRQSRQRSRQNDPPSSTRHAIRSSQGRHPVRLALRSPHTACPVSRDLSVVC